jgi:hypothetical protein
LIAEVLVPVVWNDSKLNLGKIPDLEVFKTFLERFELTERSTPDSTNTLLIKK